MKYSHDGNAAHAIKMDAAAMDQYATRVGGMFAYLDREEIAAARKRRMRKIVRRLSPLERKFALTLKHVLEVVPGPQNLHREKIMKALKIKGTVYYARRAEAEKILL